MSVRDTARNTLTLDAWVAGSAHAATTSLLLQMDIEGVLSRFRLAVIECHLLPVLRKLLLHFDVVHRASLERRLITAPYI